jgi:hypothetical protein
VRNKVFAVFFLLFLVAPLFVQYENGSSQMAFAKETDNALLLTSPPNGCLVVRGEDNSIYYRTYNSQGSSWSSWATLTTGSTGDTPAAVVVGDQLHFVVRGMSGGILWHSYLNLSTSSFSGWSAIGGSTPSVPTFTSNGTHMALVVRGDNNLIYYRLYSVASHSWGTWSTTPSGSTGDSVAAELVNNELHFVVRGMSGGVLWYSYKNLDTSSFSGWGAFGGSSPSAPTLTSNSTHLALVVRGDNNLIYYRLQNLAARTWNSWASLPSGDTGDRVASAFVGGNLQFVVRGASGGVLWHSNIDPTTSTFSGWTAIGGSSPSPPTLTPKPGQLDLWLVNHPSIMQSMVWVDENGNKSYLDWSTAKKNDLNQYFEALINGQPLQLIDPPLNQYSDDNVSVTTILSEDNAWKLYVAQVANSLYLEIENKVSWSLTQYSSVEQKILLSSNSFLAYTGTGYIIGPSYWVVPAPPDTILSFFKDNDIIKSDSYHTVGALLEWCRQNMVHFSGSITAQGCEQHWQYHGLPPVSRIINGTTSTYPGISNPFRHWTLGCLGTSGFLASVLRDANIPVRTMNIPSTGHTTAYFVSLGLYLSHGDDPYDDLYISNPQYPAIELLINSTTFNTWFPSNQPPDAWVANVGRQVQELALNYLPNHYLRDYTIDTIIGRAHSDGLLYAHFSNYYSVSYLESTGLWDRLEQKVNSIGGYSTIFSYYDTQGHFTDNPSFIFSRYQIM